MPLWARSHCCTVGPPHPLKIGVILLVTQPRGDGLTCLGADRKMLRNIQGETASAGTRLGSRALCVCVTLLQPGRRFTRAGVLNTPSLPPLPRPACHACWKILCFTQPPDSQRPPRALQASVTCRIPNEEPTAERSFTGTLQTS